MKRALNILFVIVLFVQVCLANPTKESAEKSDEDNELSLLEDEAPSAEPIPPNVSVRTKEHSISLEVSGYKYLEIDSEDEEIMNIEGERFGVNYEYLSFIKNKPFWSYQGNLSFGNLVYDGQSIGGSIKFKVNCIFDLT